MRVLVTNDDGIDAVGLAALAAAVRGDGHRVVAVAPDTESSGSAASLGVVRNENRVRLSVRDPEQFGGIEAYAVDAPPAFGVRAACRGVFGWRPDLVVSGINPGFNTGRLVVHSGTVGAAVTAASLDVCAAAFSTSARSAHGLETTAQVARCVVRGLIEAGLPPVAVNVSVPDLPIGELTGLGFTEPGAVGCDDVDFELRDGSVVVHRRRNPPPYQDGSDADLVAHGTVAVSVLTLPWRTVDAAEQVISAIEESWLSAVDSPDRFASGLRMRS